MKILYHHRTASKDGQAVHIDELVRALRSLGHEVVMIEPSTSAATGFGEGSVFVSWVRKHLPRSLGEVLELLYNVPAYLRLRRALLEHRPDFIYERYNLFLVAGALLARRYKLPYLLEVNAPLCLERQLHGGLGLPRLARFVEHWTWRQADYVLPVTAVLARMVTEAEVRAEQIVVVPNGIDPERFRGRPGIDEAKRKLGLDGRFVLGFTGFVRDWNRLEVAIDYLAVAGREDCVLLVVGDGPAVPDLKARAKRLGVGERVRFAGVVRREDVSRWMAAFDVALVPAATQYASPLKLFEYLALGLTIVAPMQPNITEILQHDRNALLLRDETESAFAAAIDQLRGSPALRAALGAGARETIETLRLTWASNAARVVRLAGESPRMIARGVSSDPRCTRVADDRELSN